MHSVSPDTCGYWLISQGSNIYFPDGNLPFGRAQEFGLTERQALHIGKWDNEPLFVVQEESAEVREWTPLRALLCLPATKFYLLNRGVELNHFVKTHQFCGKCGHSMKMAKEEWAMQCQNAQCGYRAYPVICPSIIVAVRRGTEILLANHLRHATPDGRGGIYTTLAGFVEVGETFEQTVEREVFEETGIKVKNIRYFGSQPWAFPNSQMVGFLADYDSGEIVLQETEIHDAKWFRYDDEMPELPPEGTIALKLIKATLELCRLADK
ncbi:NAD+ diphosphatase [Pasteurella langaaensis DSM 22999]|uniref:NAD-capped RNA hydrolase NudC n=1 Tax=Alitibacter langaaensis DSM 22999 TaxID=1122935 RepID=A0A2U0TCU7_9PAST|nr:NAD(+) diphosphatase [Pasteurella langaaensis]PVX41408.1 NAD+ diphosphatase [Pasteurella langaaensis DSM 22999]